MSVGYSTNLQLVEPVTGTESGNWGYDINYGTTDYIDIAIAGTNNITTDGDVTLTQTTGTTSGNNIVGTTAQYAILNCTGSRTAARNIIAPTVSKTYVVINSTTGGYAITIKKSGGTGVTIANGETAIVYYNTVSGDYARATSFNTVTAGAVAYGTSSGGIAFTAAGTSGQALLSNGSGTPTWGTAGISTGKSIAMAMVFGF
jgi:hypothetical protein